MIRGRAHLGGLAIAVEVERALRPQLEETLDVGWDIPAPDAASRIELMLTDELPPLDREAQPLYFHADCRVLRTHDAVVVRDSTSVLLVSGSRVRGWACTATGFRWSLPIAIVMLLRPLDRFYLHGAVLEHRGRALLLHGPGRSGKSSTSAAMWRAGVTCWSDDAAFLVPQPDHHVRVWGWSKPWKLHTDTASALGLVLAPGGDKGRVQVARPSGNLGLEIGWSLRVRVGSATAVTRVSSAEAFGQLLDSSSLAVLSELDGQSVHLEVLQDVAARAFGGELVVGRDLLESPDDIVAEVLSALDSVNES